MLSRTFVQERIQKSAAAPAPEEPEEFELTNIRVKEVSLVDRPANKRSFLVRKRDQKTEKGQPPSDKASTFADLDKADRDKAEAERKAEEEAQSEREKAILAGTAKAENTPSKTEPNQAPAPTPSPGGDPAVPGDVNPPAPAPAPAAPPAQAPKPDGNDKTVEQKLPPKDDDDVTTVKTEAESEEGVEKVGRKMSRARREKLKAAFESLANMLAEVEEGTEEAAKAAADPPAKDPPAKEEPAEDQPAKDRPASDPAKQPPVQQPPAQPEDSPAMKAMLQKLETLGATVEGLQKMVKEQGEQLAKRQLPAKSNSISLEVAKHDLEDLPWPADLAASPERIKGRVF